MVNEKCANCFEYHKLDCAGVYHNNGNPDCYLFREPMKHIKTELIANHYDKINHNSEMEIELVELLLEEHKQLLLEKIKLEKQLYEYSITEFKRI
jgi:hypothetical protein